MFLSKLDALEAFGGCCCVEEKFWHGLQLALAYTPDYTSIFCFTDAGANDAELMDSVVALAVAKHCKVREEHFALQEERQRRVNKCEYLFH